MGKRNERTDEEKEHVKSLIISKKPTYAQLVTLYHAEQNKVRDRDKQIATYQVEIRKWRTAKRRLRIFLGVYWEANFDLSDDNKIWSFDDLRKWRNNLARFVQENWGFYSLDGK